MEGQRSFHPYRIESSSMAAVAGSNRLLAERAPSTKVREEREKQERSQSPLRGLLIAAPIGAAMWALIIWLLSFVPF